MSAATITAPIRHEPELSGQTIVVIGGRLLLMGRTCGRRRGIGLGVASTVAAALPPSEHVNESTVRRKIPCERSA